MHISKHQEIPHILAGIPTTLMHKGIKFWPFSFTHDLHWALTNSVWSALKILLQCFVIPTCFTYIIAPTTVITVPTNNTFQELCYKRHWKGRELNKEDIKVELDFNLDWYTIQIIPFGLTSNCYSRVSSLHWLILGFLNALSVQWSILTM